MGYLKSLAVDEGTKDVVPDWPEQHDVLCDLDAKAVSKYTDEIQARSAWLAQSALAELRERDSQSKKAGRPAMLKAYREYKSEFISRWANFVTERARQDGVSTIKLAAAFGYTESSEWRALQRGECYRMTHQRFVAHTKWTMRYRGWGTMRAGCLVRSVNEKLMSPSAFEEWAREAAEGAPQNCHK